jgi:hypothetical protein
MTDNKICPICSTENPKNIDKCQNCGFLFMDSEKDNTDWLDNLRSENIENSDFQNTESERNSFSIPEETPSTGNDDVPDWLLRIREKKETETNYQQFNKNKSFSEESNNPFSQDTSSQDESKVEPQQENVPDWLNQMRTDPFKPEEQSSILDSSDLPDWLTGKETEDAFITENNDPTPDEDLPDWLSNISSQQENKSEEKQQNFDISDEDTIAEQSEKKSESTEPVSPFGNIQIEEDGQEELPDWLKNTSPDSPITDFENTPYAGSDPDWLKEISEIEKEDDVEKKSEEESSIQFPQPISSEPLEPSEFIIPPFSESTANDNTMSNESSTMKSGALNNEIPEIKNEEAEDIDFLFDYQQDSVEYTPFIEEQPSLSNHKPSDSTSQPFTLGDMPDWLEDIDKVKNEELEDTLSNQTEKIDDKVQPGSLPSWLKAMRPVSAVVPNEIRTEDRKKIEKSGPLAGLQGVLSSETAINHYTPPPTYASKVNVTEKNKLHARLLEEVFSKEKKQKNKTLPKTRFDYTFARLIIPALLLVALIFSFVNKSNIGSGLNNQRNLPAEQFASIANTLSTTVNDAPHILVVMDSDAASIGELALVTQRTFETFMVQNSWLVIVGTNPSGLIVSDEMTKFSKQNVSSFNEFERVINLGYLPGNETGIQGFISNPKLMVQLLRNGRSVWESPGLQTISTVNDFDSVWIISDNAESTQKWIEQLQLINFNKPLLISATTQATPLLSAYLKAGLFDGLVGGLQGATAYEQLTTNSPIFFNQTWHLYRAVIFIFLVIILAGAVIQIVESILISKNK